MIISDSNILSSFAAAKSLSLLFTALAEEVLFIPPSVRQELQEGLNRGQIHLAQIENLLDTGKLRVVTLTDQDQKTAIRLPSSFGPGEREGVALCLRIGAKLLSNEKRVVNYCARNNIACLDLVVLLRLLWTKEIVTKSKVKTMMRRMIQVEGIVFKHSSEILADARDDFGGLD